MIISRYFVDDFFNTQQRVVIIRNIELYVYRIYDNVHCWWPPFVFFVPRHLTCLAFQLSGVLSKRSAQPFFTG